MAIFAFLEIRVVILARGQIAWGHAQKGQSCFDEWKQNFLLFLWQFSDSIESDNHSEHVAKGLGSIKIDSGSKNG
jgi:hypothetical protein